MAEGCRDGFIESGGDGDVYQDAEKEKRWNLAGGGGSPTVLGYVLRAPPKLLFAISREALGGVSVDFRAGGMIDCNFHRSAEGGGTRDFHHTAVAVLFSG
jgi:hypothetical protein